MRGLLISILVFVIQSLALANEPPGVGENPQSITLYTNHTKCRDLTNIPLLIDGSVMPAAFWQDVEPNGADIWITDANGVELPREVVLPSNYKTKCILNFDDIYSSFYNVAYPIMEAYGFKGVSCVMGNFIGVSGYLTLANATTLYDAGWDLINHTIDHNVLPPHTTEWQTEAIQLGADYLYNHGFTRRNMYKHFAHPGGKYDTNTFTALAACGVITARPLLDVNYLFNYGYNLNVPVITDPYLLKLARYNLCETGCGYTVLEDVKDKIDIAIETGTTVIFVLHRVVDDPNIYPPSYCNNLCWSTANFQALMDYLYLKRDQIEVTTLTEWYDGLQTDLNNVAIDVNNQRLEVWFGGNTSSTRDLPYTIHWGDWGLAKDNNYDVWDVNTKMVQHMGQSAFRTAPQLIDSTINANNLTASSGWVTNKDYGVTGGKIGTATDFNAVGNFTKTGGDVNLHDATITGATISFWADINMPSTIFSKGTDLTNNVGIKFTNTSDFNMAGKIGGGSANWKYTTGLADFRNAWHYYAMRWNNSTDELSLYIDGVCVLTGTDTNNWPTDTTLSIGANTILKGPMDEVRISDVDRGEDWIYTSYQNQNDPEGFWSGGEKSFPVDPDLPILGMFCVQWLKDVDCFGQPDCPDLTHDDYVNFADYAELMRDLGI